MQDIHRSATTLERQVGEMNNVDHFVHILLGNVGAWHSLVAT